MGIIGILVLLMSFFFRRGGYIDDAREYRLASRPYDLRDAYGFGSGQFRSAGDPVFYIGGEYHE